MPLRELLGIFPKLARSRTRIITSPVDWNYNCTAYAIEDTARWWQPYGFILPTATPEYHWPDGLPHNEDLDTFIRFFELHGYEPADDGETEAGYRKIALYAMNGEFRHVARQMRNGRWSSKLGGLEDISHELDAIEGSGEFGYGNVAMFMKKPNR